MKNILKQFPLLSFAVLPVSTLLVYSWQNPNQNNYSNKASININQKDTSSKNDHKESNVDVRNLGKALKSPEHRMADLDVQMKDYIYKLR